MEWRPIETAPVGDPEADEWGDDPPRILVWVEGRGVAFGHVYQRKRTKTRRVTAEGFSGDWEITHWMPLPEPPQ